MKTKFLVAITAITVFPSVAANGFDIENRWLQFRDHLPQDVRENIDRNFRALDFELMAKVQNIEEQRWCDNVSVYIPLSDEAEQKWRLFWDSFGTGISRSERDKLREDAGKLTKPTKMRQAELEQELTQKCEVVAKQYPHLARVVSP